MDMSVMEGCRAVHARKKKDLVKAYSLLLTSSYNIRKILEKVLSRDIKSFEKTRIAQ